MSAKTYSNYKLRDKLPKPPHYKQPPRMHTLMKLRGVIVAIFMQDSNLIRDGELAYEQSVLSSYIGNNRRKYIAYKASLEDKLVELDAAKKEATRRVNELQALRPGQTRSSYLRMLDRNSQEVESAKVFVGAVEKAETVVNNRIAAADKLYDSIKLEAVTIIKARLCDFVIGCNRIKRGKVRVVDDEDTKALTSIVLQIDSGMQHKQLNG